jgi:DNA-binding ferritin-like protein (Dps family)
MRRRLVDVYSQVFFFLRDIMEWYLKSRTSRFFQSFNDNVNKKFEEVVKSIEANINEMYKESQIGGLAMQREALSTIAGVEYNVFAMHNKVTSIGADIQDFKDELIRQRQQAYREPAEFGFDVGNFMRETLLSNFEEVTFKREGIEFIIRKGGLTHGYSTALTRR